MTTVMRTTMATRTTMAMRTTMAITKKVRSSMSVELMTLDTRVNSTRMTTTIHQLVPGNTKMSMDSTPTTTKRTTTAMVTTMATRRSMAVMMIITTSQATEVLSQITDAHTPSYRGAEPDYGCP